MADATKIAWTESTFNPWRGCVKVSEGCKHCYAETWSKRTGKKIWGADAAREHAAESYWKKPLTWNTEAHASGQRRLVFCSSLADVCENRDDLLEARARLMRLIEMTQDLTWLLLTKRPENFLPLFGRRWSSGWPKNVWAMTTAEDQKNADVRLALLSKVPAAVLGVSYEPAIEAVDFVRAQRGHARKVDWIIAGGESGTGARPFHLNWARAARDACRETGAAFFMKQVGAHAHDTHADGRPICRAKTSCTGFGDWNRTLAFQEPKGGDPAEWPEDLRVREFPAT